MTPTYWLLAGLVAFILVVMALSHIINIELRNGDETFYRTADIAAIRQQTKRIIAKANAHMPATGTTRAATCCCNQTTAWREGTAAALHDMGQKPGTPPSANPYAHDALAHVAWRRAYQRGAA